MTVKIFLCSVLLLSALGLRPAPSALATPIQATEPAIHSNAPVPSEAGTDWRKFSSLEGRFSVLLPVKPSTRTHVLPSSKIVLHELICQDDAKVYIIIYEDLPLSEVLNLGAEDILAINDRATFKVTSSSLVSERHLTLGSYPGHELVTDGHNGMKKLRRNYLVGARLFTLNVVEPLGQAQVMSNDSSKFFGSFALISAKMPTRNR